MRRLAFPLLAFALPPALAVLSRPATADVFRRDESTLTVTRPVHVPGAVLAPGTYLVRLVEKDHSHTIVQFTDTDRRTVFATTIATPDERVVNPARTEFVFDEEDGEPVALRTWWAPNDRFGQDFVYSPEDEAAIRADATKIAEAHLPANPGTAIAQGGPPREEAAPALSAPATPEPAEVVAEKPATALPRTASDTPLLFLVGLASLASAATLRATVFRGV